jgi:hypothetical protein
MNRFNTSVGGAAVCLLFFVSACGLPDAEASATQATAESSLTQRRSRDVTVSRTDRYLLANGTVVKQAVSVAGTAISASVTVNGIETTLPSTLTSTGTATIAGVPPGAYWLIIGSRWYLTHEREIDLGLENLGRPNVVQGSPGSALSVTGAGLTPFSPNDEVQLFSANAGIGFYSTASGSNAISANAPAAGDTGFSQARFPFDNDANTGSVAYPLLDAAQGDTLTISQLSFSSLGSAGIFSQALSKTATVSVSMADGAVTALTTAFTDAPRVQTTLDYRLAEMEAQAAEIAPGATPSSAGLFIDANSTGRTIVAGTPDLFIAIPPTGMGNQTLAISYGDPFPCAWSRYIATPVGFSVPYTGLNAAGAPLTSFTSATAFSQFIAHGAQQTLKPLITPPRSLLVDGHAGQEIFTVSTTPTLTWQAPRIGEARQYIVQVRRISSQNPVYSRVATLLVDGSVKRLRLPAGLLQAGQHYHFVVTGLTEEFDFERPNAARAFPLGLSPTFSATVLAQ